MTLQPTAISPREPMPARLCAGFQRSCTTPLSRYNPDSVCSVCSSKRADAIAAQRHKPGSDLATHCRHGHLYTIASTYWAKRGRVCRECARVREFGRRPRADQW